ncbi:MAG: DUF6951 family protein [Candidatus Methanomethylicaceae archaeon]
MTTTFEVTTICDHLTKITATLVGTKIKVTMDSTCKKIQHYGLLLHELSVKEIAKDIINNSIYQKAAEARLEPNCLVPCGVAFCTWTEAGLVSRNLLSRSPSQCITYEVRGTEPNRV